MTKQQNLRGAASSAVHDLLAFRMAQITGVVSEPHIRNLTERAMRGVETEVEQNSVRWQAQIGERVKAQRGERAR
jgi:hypothetical protein